MTRKHREMDAAAVEIRANDARKHLEVAELYLNGATAADWKVSGSNSVSAGIAATDAICGIALGYCALGQDHNEAIAFVTQASPPGARTTMDLRRLLSEKSLFQYGAERVTRRRSSELFIYAGHLLKAMERALKR